MDYRSVEQQLQEILSLQRRPVAVTFRDTPPAGMAKFTGMEPSGCSFWRIAAQGGRHTRRLSWYLRNHLTFVRSSPESVRAPVGMRLVEKEGGASSPGGS